MTINLNEKLLYLLAGTGVGAMIGMLLAPKSGQDLRSTISSKVEEGRRLVEEKSPLIGESVRRAVERGKNVASIGKQRMNESIEAGKTEYDRLKGRDVSGI
jgi:gas vesicle protein